MSKQWYQRRVRETIKMFDEEFVDLTIELFRKKFTVDPSSYPSLTKGELNAVLNKVNRKVLVESKIAHGKVSKNQLLEELKRHSASKKRKRPLSCFHERRERVTELQDSVRHLQTTRDKYLRLANLLKEMNLKENE
eukprot:TRINITY_DN8561_c0_g1_i3.p1 TRINITY_DN8561_c0_g1~~TRINITY_DN8561_c0_g1_i3.p1  ORF type:complete len:136 (+),score=35.12 TRINITY_DN8561_c0_g1_i3:19-426(+)